MRYFEVVGELLPSLRRLTSPPKRYGLYACVEVDMGVDVGSKVRLAGCLQLRLWRCGSRYIVS